MRTQVTIRCVLSRQQPKVCALARLKGVSVFEVG
jgi:hypothetical protein